MGSPGSPRFTVRTDVSNGVARLALAGELDMAFAPTLEDHLRRLVNDGAEAALLDLRDLTFMDAAGLNVLIRATDDADRNGHRIAIVGVGGTPRRVFEITDMDRVLIDATRGMELIRRFTADAASHDASSAEAGDRHDA